MAAATRYLALGGEKINQSFEMQNRTAEGRNPQSPVALRNLRYVWWGAALHLAHPILNC
jgi:hypothetical protein